MTTHEVRRADIVSRAVGLFVLGLATCVLLWLYIDVADSPTATNHNFGDTYLPNGLYLATVLSVLVSFAVTVSTDLILGRSTWTAFVIGFIVGLVIFLWNIPWSQLDSGGEEMFGVAMWWVAPMLGTATYVGNAVLNELK